MTVLKNSIRRKHSQMGYTTNLEEKGVAGISGRTVWRKEQYRQLGDKLPHSCKHSKLNVV